MNVNSTGVSEVVKAPYLIKKRVSCEYAVEVEREEVEKLKFLRRNVYSLTVELKLVLFTAYLNVFKLDRLVVILVVVRGITSEDSLDSRGKLLHLERFNNKVIRTESDYLVENLILSRDHDDRLGRNSSYFSANLVAVLIFRKHEVKQNEIRLIHFEIAETFYTVVRGFYFISFIFKIEL